MAFMEPVYDNGPFSLVTNAQGESTLVPAGYEDPAENETVEPAGDGWFCQLSANGYMDQTGWSGPFPTEAAAREHIAETYDVDPDTGEDLDGAEDEESAS